MIAWLLACAGPPPDVEDAPPGLVAAPGPGEILGWPDVAIGADGRVWVSYAAVDPDEHTRLRLTWSDDAGETFAPPVDVGRDPLFLGTVRQPILAVDGDRLAIAAGGGDYLDSSVLLYALPTSAPAPTTPQVLDQAALDPSSPGGALALVDQPELAFDTDGTLLVTWKRSTRDERVGMVVAREGDGFAPALLATPGGARSPCECCPVDLRVSPRTGRTWLAFRNDIRDVRDIWLFEAQGAAAFDDAHQVSTSGWKVGGCPFDGPALGETDAGLVAAWVDGTAGDNYGYAAISTDGATWGPQRRLLPDLDASQTWPTLAVDALGVVWVAVEEVYRRVHVVRSDDAGRGFVEVVVPGPALRTARLTSGADAVGLVGVDEGGSVWYRALE